jgi:hypothetical protein
MKEGDRDEGTHSLNFVADAFMSEVLGIQDSDFKKDIRIFIGVLVKKAFSKINDSLRSNYGKVLTACEFAWRARPLSKSKLDFTMMLPAH